MVRETKTDTGTDITRFEVTLNQEPGEIESTHTLEGNLEVTGGQLARQAASFWQDDQDTINVRYTVNGLNEFGNWIRSGYVSSVSDLTGVPGGIINQQLPSTRIRDLSTIESVGEELRASLSEGILGGLQQTGRSPVSGGISLDFDPIRVPVPEGANISRVMDDMPESAKPVMRVEAVPANFFNRTFGNRAAVEFTLEPTVLVEGVSLGDINCMEAFSGLDQRMSNLSNSISNKAANLRRQNSSMQDILDDIGDRPPTQVATNQDLISRIESVFGSADPRDDVDGFFDSLSESESEMQGVRQQVEEIGVPTCSERFNRRVGELERQLSTLRERTNRFESLANELFQFLDIDPIEACDEAYSSATQAVTDFRSTVDSLQQGVTANRIQELTSRADELESIVDENVPSDSPCQDRLRSRIERARRDLTSMEGRELGCGDVQRNLRNAVASFEAAAEQFQELDRIERTPDRRQRLIEESQEVRDRISTEVESSNPCRQELLARVSDAGSSIRGSPVRSETELPCSQRFPDVMGQVRAYEDRVLNASAPLSINEVNQLTVRGRDVLESIRSEIDAGDPCRQELTERVTNLINRVSQLTESVRITTEDMENRRDELLQSLLTSIEGINSDLPDGGDQVDVTLPDPVREELEQ